MPTVRHTPVITPERWPTDLVTRLDPNQNNYLGKPKTTPVSIFNRIAATMSDTLVDRDQPVSKVEGNLYAPQGDDGNVEGDQGGRSFSSFTTVRRHPRTAMGLAIAVALAAGYLLAGKRAEARHV